jgi:hypothetical protein
VRDEKNRTVSFSDAALPPGETSRTLILSNPSVLVLDFDSRGHVAAALDTPRLT